MRSPRSAEDGDRLTAWSLVRMLARDPPFGERETNSWLEEGLAPSIGSPVLDVMVKMAEELRAERARTAAEVAAALGRDDVFREADTVCVLDRGSKHYGKNGTVLFVRDGRVMVSIAGPRGACGPLSDSFLPEHLEHRDSPSSASPERVVLLRALRENVEMFDNLSSTQARCTVLLEATRALRQKIVELGGEDPGPA